MQLRLRFFGFFVELSSYILVMLTLLVLINSFIDNFEIFSLKGLFEVSRYK